MDRIERFINWIFRHDIEFFFVMVAAMLLVSALGK
jgi:hypothetical protein